MPLPFKFLSVSEFEKLPLEEKSAYLRAATAELERTNVDHAAGGYRLFRQDQQQTQQQQARPKDNKP